MRTPNTATCLMVLALAAVLATGPAWAAALPPAATVSSGAAPAGSAGAPGITPSGTAAPDPNIIREESIYIPYAKLREVFEKEGRGVFLPYEKFQQLWQAARDHTPAAVEARPPVDSIITEFLAKATVSKDVVTVVATVRIEVLKEGWNEIPLRLADAAITQATIDDQPARIVSDGPRGYNLLLEKKGKEPRQYSLTLGFAKAYTKAPGQNSVSFEAPQAPVSKWEVRIPESGVKVNVHPLLAATEVPPATKGAEETVVLAFVGAAPTVRIDWNPKAEGAKGLEALASVKVEQQTSIEEGVTRTRALLVYDISRAELGRLEVEVPADQKVVNVFDANVREWSVAPPAADKSAPAGAGDVQKISVQLFEPAKQTQSLLVELEKFSSDAKLDVRVPVIKAVGVGRQQGVVVVQVAQGLRAEASDHTGLLQLDVAELPQSMKGGKWDFSYRYAALPFNLALAVEKVLPRVTADSLVEAHLVAETMLVNLTTVYTIERAGVFKLELDIPEGYDIRSVVGVQVGDAQPVQVDAYHKEAKPEAKVNSSSTLVVNLTRKAMGKVALAVALQKMLREPDLLAPTGKTADIPLAIPRVIASSVERETGRLVVYAPESLSVNPGKQAGLRVVSFQEAVLGMRTTQGPVERPVLAFAFTQEPASLALAAERRKPQVNVRQLLVARIESGVVKYEATFFYDVLYSGVKSLRVDVPADLGASIHIEPVSIRHEAIAAADKPKDLLGGYEAWRLSGDSEFMGAVQIKLVWEKAIEKLDIGQSVDLAIPRLIPRETDRAWGQIVLVKAETLDVQPSDAKDKVTGLRPIDPQRDLMPGASVPGAARALEFNEDWVLTIVARMFKFADVKPTSIERGLVRMVATRGDLVSVQALFRIRSARQRLEVVLPAGLQKLDSDPLRINGRAVNLETGGQPGANRFFIPLVGQSPDVPFILDLRYTIAGTGLALDCPAFPEEPAVQKVYLSAWLPREWRYLGSRGPWTDELVWTIGRRGLVPRATLTDADLIRWLREGLAGDNKAELSFQTDGQQYLFSTLCPAAPPEGTLRITAVHGDLLSVLVFAVVLLAGIALMFTRWTVRAVAVGALLALLVLVGVFLPTLAHQTADVVLMSACFIVLVLWTLWYFLVTRPRDPAVQARREARRAMVAAMLSRKTAAPAPVPPWMKSGPPAGSAPTAPPPPPADEKKGGEPHA